MGLWIGRAGQAVVAAGTGTGTMKMAGQWTDARHAMGRLHRSGPRRPPESSPPSPGGSSSASNHRASRPSAGAALSRAGSVNSPRWRRRGEALERFTRQARAVATGSGPPAASGRGVAAEHQRNEGGFLARDPIGIGVADGSQAPARR